MGSSVNWRLRRHLHQNTNNNNPGGNLEVRLLRGPIGPDNNTADQNAGPSNNTQQRWRNDNRSSNPNNSRQRNNRNSPWASTNADRQGGNTTNGRPPNDRKRFVGFRHIQELVQRDDIDQIVMQMSNDRNGFQRLLESDKMSEDMIVMLIKLFARVCDVTFDHTKVAVLRLALTSAFIEKLNVYLAQIVAQNEKEKQRNKFLWNELHVFWENILKIFKELVERMPATSCDAVRKLLTVIKINLPHIEETHKVHISDEIKNNVVTLMDVVEKAVEREKNSHKSIDYGNPPDDFRNIPIIPTPIEVTTEQTPFYRPNVVDRPYDDVEHYLDVQFRLLREDFVAPLRKGICTYINNNINNVKGRIEDVKIYNNIQFISVEIETDRNCYRLQFNSSNKRRNFNYDTSRIFMYGSLVCFTSDNFKSIQFGKIVNRDQKLLEAGELVVEFEDDVEIDFDKKYVMVESKVYFEPYFQVLGVLKRISTDRFPMEKYIVHVDRNVGPPRYLTLQTRFTIEARIVVPLALQQDEVFYKLNQSQMKAFRAALSNEFCIIQGPPGTGKTHLGLKIVQTLLENRKVWHKNTPMLVICYTNAALDQFLEGLLPMTDDILRVGGQSKNEALKQYNLRNRRLRTDTNVIQIGHRLRECLGQLKRISSTLQMVAGNEVVLDVFETGAKLMRCKESWFQKASKADVKNWLFGGREYENRHAERFNMQEVQNDMQNMEVDDVNNPPAPPNNDVNMLDELDESRDMEIDDLFDNIKVDVVSPIVSVQMLRESLDRINVALIACRTQPECLATMIEETELATDYWVTEQDLYYLQFRLRQAHLLPRTRPAFTDMKNPQNMCANDRWQLYFYFLREYVLQLRANQQTMTAKYKQIYRVYNELRDIDTVHSMRSQLVVGMTTTGAARLQTSLQALKCPIVVVEEAAEVLEAHIVAALTDHCQHLILIGDHQQLKPSAASYKIEKDFKLGISMFERMVMNKLECHMLDVQHRMRPEISALICPTIYPHLLDHKDTMDRPHITGIDSDLYFIDHQEPEKECHDNSKMNEHEAEFLIALARHLVLNGYEAEQIVILVAYLGQFFHMRSLRAEHGDLLRDIRIAVLDNYQGEESDIILLSLVRSNKEGKVGFLKIENRVCVALSRARNGFYIMGNMKHLTDNSDLWKKVRATLEQQNAIGPKLTLRCQVHRSTTTEVSKKDDFTKISEGGCHLPCGAPLQCAHVCKRLCHVYDREHTNYKCLEVCGKILCNDQTHTCKKKCYDECGPCNYPMERDLPCGHTTTIDCHIDPNEYKCQHLVNTTLPCEHVTDKPCSADPDTFRCPFPCDTRVEPCGHACALKCHIRFDANHIKYKCKKDCERPRHGCQNPEDESHKCTLMCYQECEPCAIGVNRARSCGHMFKVACHINIEDANCDKPCKKMLACGHKCKSKCFEECGKCKEKLQKKVPDCNHVIKIECHKEADRKYCNKKCPRKLPCGHVCTKTCAQECTMKCLVMVDCDILTPCGHRIKTIQCYLKNSSDADEYQQQLMDHCTAPCNATLKCEDTCGGTCGECHQGRIHKRCDAKCGRLLVCDHECPLTCRQACKPCEKRCEFRCGHSKCGKKCGEPCTPCKEKCKRKCRHQQCRRKCASICDVPPCTKKCPKKLKKCRHQCVGFCGDPCPKLCRICDKEKLQELFLGREDEEDAIFVQLSDCGHVLESEGLEEWMAQDSNAVQAKTCPRCKSKIITTARYSDHVKRALIDLMQVKRIEYGNANENDRFRKTLLQDLGNFTTTISESVNYRPTIFLAIEALQARLLPTRNDKRQSINKMQLTAIQSKLQMLQHSYQCFASVDFKEMPFHNFQRSSDLLNLIVNVVLASEDAITTQEIEDVQCEINRLKRLVQFEGLEKGITYRNCASTNPEMRQQAGVLLGLLNPHKKYTGATDKDVMEKLKTFATLLKSTLRISDFERRQIVQAINLTPGHWFKCPNGHYYAIGECGGAMQESKCPECGVLIGGEDHRLLPGQQFAPEMDGATAPAWPGVHY